mmetsp:Transcript_36360/g.55834  ORF Transcript_36360/g.55834 Transcript_36360/m.55834 type:complete len:96 (-) Transcript_36360:33-320(-)
MNQMNNLKTESLRKLETEPKMLVTDKSNNHMTAKLPHSRFQEEHIDTRPDEDLSSRRGVSLKKLQEKSQPTRTRPMAPRKAKSTTMGGLKRNLQA